MMSTYRLFDAVGIELEYMIVDRETLAVRPFADRVLAAVNGGEVTSEVDFGTLSWSNELVAHVLELKTTRPAAVVDEALCRAFVDDLRRIDGLLADHGARLLPTAMHPTMDPLRETVLWPHDFSPVYQAYDRIFGCKGHGWSNLQSLHLNYPFAGDREFGRLHAGIRLLLPLLPALAASSPVVEGRPTRFLDNRLEFYRTNSKAIPSVVGSVVPEPVFTRADYEARIFEPMYSALAPQDPEGILRDEFLNARGAIARFGRGSVEIRVIDVQECPRADLAIAAACTAVLRLLEGEHTVDLERQQAWPTEPLAHLLVQAAETGAETVIDDPDYLRVFGAGPEPVTAGELWSAVAETTAAHGYLDAAARTNLDELVSLGPVAARIRKALGPEPTREQVIELYGRLGDCLLADELFRP